MRLVAVGAMSCLFLGLALGVVGCGRQPRLVPARTAERMAEIPSAAAAEVRGVRFAIEGDAWPDRSVPLANGVTPVLVMIENRGDAPVVVRHDDFVLARENGERLEALAPDAVPVSGPTGSVIVPEPGFSPADPAVVDPLRAFPPAPNPATSMSPMETSFPYNHLYVRGATVARPARGREPLARALPEGTLARGQRSAGFVYFAGALGGGRRMVFEARLVRETGHGGQSVEVAEAKIPMRVQ